MVVQASGRHRGVMDSALLVVGAALLAVVAAAGCAVVRIVPAGHEGVVMRLGQPLRSRSSGLAVVVPGLERLHLVSLTPTPIEPLAVTGSTRDGVEVRLVLSLSWGVADPVAAAQAKPDVRLATADGVERAAHRLLASVDLSSLLRDREEVLSRLPVTALPLLAPLGVALVDVDLLDAQLRVGPELLRLLG
jgi:regulator of protease activity HflC (stomatin/prohibitin superfamily)